MKNQRLNRFIRRGGIIAYPTESCFGLGCDPKNRKAINKIKTPSFNEESISSDKDYISKKYGITRQEFDNVLNIPPKNYKDFPNDKTKIERFYNLYRRLSSLK